MGISQADIGSELDVNGAVVRRISGERHLRTTLAAEAANVHTTPPGSSVLASVMPEFGGTLSGSGTVSTFTGVNTLVDRTARAIGTGSLPATTGLHATRRSARYCTPAGTENRVAATGPHALSVTVHGGALVAPASMRNRTKAKYIAASGQAGFGITTIIESGPPVCRNRKVDSQVAGRVDSLSGCVNKQRMTTNPKNRPEIPKKAHTLDADLKDARVAFSAASVREKATAPNADLYKAQLMKA